MNRQQRFAFLTAVVLSACVGLPAIGQTVSTPAIRTSATNKVPTCVTPDRLDAFLNSQISQRGYRLSAGHNNIAKWYQKHGDAHRIRWDYAFFQMALETNFLSFRRANGERGDVHPRQNNFAGLGTTGGGVPGDSYPDVSTGVLAQIQHLVVYSGEQLARPIGHRTRLKQHVILQSVSKIVRQRPVQFADLAGRWAADKRYGRSIERLAKRFFSEHCTARPVIAEPPRPVPAPQKAPEIRTEVSAAAVRAAPETKSAEPAGTKPPKRGTDRIAKVAMAAALTRSPPTDLKGHRAAAIPHPQRESTTKPARACRIQVASYGGTRAVLIENVTTETVNLTALNVQPGFEEMMIESFIQSHAPSGKALGTFPDRPTAVARAQALCRELSVK